MTASEKSFITPEYSEILDSLPQWLFIVSEQRELLFINKAARIFLGLPSDVLTTWPDLVSSTPEIFENVRINEALKRSDYYQQNFSDKNGVYYSLTVNLLETWADSFAGQYFLVSIFPQKQNVAVTDKLHHEMSFQALLDAMPDLIFLLNSHGEFISYRAPNSSALALPPEAFLGKSIDTVLPPSLSTQTRIHLKAALDTGNLQVYEYSLEVPLGSQNIRYFESRMTKCGSDAVLTIIRDTTERQMALAHLVESEEQYRNVVEHSNDGICVLQDGVVKFANPQLSILSGYPLEKMVGLDFVSLIQPAFQDMVSHKYNLIIDGKEDNQRYETQLLRPDQGTIEVEFNISSISFLGRRAALAFVRDISERKRSEEELLSSLKEKDVLLREVHHRVKNNLQIVSSMLHLQSATIQDKASQMKIVECQARIRSMALIHTKLYQSENISKINFTSYLRSLVANLYRLYGRDENEISYTIKADDVHLDLETAIPCGLIVNELFSNSLKHAFPSSMQGNILLKMSHLGQGEYEIAMSDDGVGFPANFSLDNAESLGLTLVTSLVEQLEGTLELRTDKGTNIAIRFQQLTA